MNKCLIIAEAGVNHNGSLDNAKRLVDVAREAGADVVKFQTFKAEKLVSKAAKQADYQKKNTEGTSDSQFDLLKKLELSEQDHFVLAEYANTKGIQFFSTAFDEDGIDFLDKLGVSLFKIPSGEITNLPYLKKIAQRRKSTLLSTGMATLGEIEAAVSVLLENGLQRSDITVLHCNTEYPTPFGDVNLRAMNTIGRALGVRVGYSDHTMGIEVPVAAVALGAVCIEKHFTLSRQMEGPDHKASLEPGELKLMVQSIRHIEKAMGGSGLKLPSPSETKNKSIARKSIHLRHELPAGSTLQEKDLVMKRPGNGISPMNLDQIIGRSLKQALPEDTLLTYQHLV